MTETRTNDMPSRRAVTKTAAWAAPVIAAAVAAPMAAASGGNTKNGHISWNPDASNNNQYSATGSNTLRIAADTPGGKAYKNPDQWTIDLTGSSIKVATALIGTTVVLGVPFTVSVTYVSAKIVTVTIIQSFQFPQQTDVIFPAGTFVPDSSATGTNFVVAPSTDPSLSNNINPKI